jgi:hypothetical protein
MSCREPKLSALLAAAQQRLSPAGERRWQAHLLGCAVCREEATQPAARVLSGLTETARQAAAPALDWERMGPALARWREESRAAQSPRRWQRAAPVLVGLAAALALGYLALRPSQRATPQVADSIRSRVAAPVAPAEPAPPLAVPPEPAVLQGVRWTLARMAAPPAPVPFQEGAVLVTGAGESLHVQLEPGMGFVLEPSSRLRLARLRAGEVELGLEAGAVTSHVRKLGPGERYAVRTAEQRVAVRGTRFRVALGQTGSEVSIDEGLVAITRLSGELLAELHAPGRWPTSPASPASPTRPAPPGALVDPHGYLQPLADWPLLRVPVLAGARALQIGETRVTEPGVLALRVPPGAVELRAELADGRRLATRIHAEGAALTVDATKLRALNPAPRRPQPVAVAPAALASVLHRSAPALQRCYERSLLRQPQLEGRFRLKVQLDATGRVASTQVSGGDAVPSALTQCFSEVTARWQFPQSAAGSELEAPLNLTREPAP